MESVAKIFTNGDSQAVRLPEEFRFECEKVRVRKEGSAVILEPITDDWAWLDNLDIPADEDFLRAALDARNVEHQPRPEIDDLFK